MAHILKLKQIREGDVIGSFGRSNEVTVKSIEKDVPMLVDGTTGIRLTFHTEISPGRNWVTMGPEETLLVMNPGRRQPPAYEPPPPPQQGDKINGYCPVCNRDVTMKLGGRIPNHNSSKPGRGRGIKGNRCEGSGKTLEEAREIKAEQERKYRLLGYASVGATASVSRTGTPSPSIDVTWTEHDSWREGDPPKDPNYADRYFTFRIAHQGRSGPPVPEPINVIEAMIHDLTAFGRPEFRWEVDGTSQWGDDFGAHGTTTDLDAAKAQAAAAVQRASDEFWAKYDDSETPKGPPGGFPWDHRASKTAAASDDLAFEQDEVEASYLNARIDGVVVARIDTRSFDIRWIDGMDSRGAKTLAAAKATVKERIDRPSYRRLLTEAPVGTAWPKTASVIDYSVCPDCGNRLQWGDSEIHSLKPGVYGSPEDYAICIHCGITWTEESIEEARMEKDATRKVAVGNEPPPIAPGFVVVRVDSHRADDKLKRLVGPNLSYGRWEHGGDYHVILEEHLAEATAIAGVTHVKRPETHTDHHFHWDQDRSIPGIIRNALNEQKAPPEVDTLRDEQCPVCFPPETLVRTREGWLPIASIQEGDVVLSKGGAWNPVLEVMENDYDGALVEIDVRSCPEPIRATPEHPFWTMVSNHHHDGPCKPGRCQPMGTSFRTRGNRWGESREITHHLDWMDAGSLASGQFVGANFPASPRQDQAHVTVPSKFLGARRQGPSSFLVDDDFLWMVGMYLAEGSKGRRSINFALHEKEVEYQDRLVSFFERHGFSPAITTKEGSKGIWIEVYSTMLAEWFPEWLGRSCDTKAIPAEFMDLPLDRLGVLIGGIMDGDEHDSREILGQTSEVLALQVAEWAMATGQPLSIYTERPSGKLPVHRLNRKASAKRSVRLWDLDGTRLAEVRDVRRVPYAGKVYNLRVANDPSYTVQNILVHNCGETDAYSGQDCAVCGFVKPPDLFTDPDIDKAKEVNLRQDQKAQEDAGLTPEGDPAPTSGLEQFRVDGPAQSGTNGPGAGLERFKVGAKTDYCPECNSEQEHPRFRIGRGTCRNEFHSKAKTSARDPYAEGYRAGKGRNPNWIYRNDWPIGTPEHDQYVKGWEAASGQKRAAVTGSGLLPDTDVFTCPWCEKQVNYLRDVRGGFPVYTCTGCGHEITLPHEDATFTYKGSSKAASGRVEVVIDYGKCYMSQPSVAEKLLRGLEAFRRNQDSTDRRVWTVPQMMWDEWHIATSPDDAEEIVSALGELGVNSRFVKVKQAKVAGFGDESEWMEGGDDRVYLVDTDNRPIIYGDDASATPASFLWPRAEAQAAIGTAYVKDPGYDLPAAQIMDPQHYVVTWADRHGQSAWWLMSREHQAKLARIAEVGKDWPVIHLPDVLPPFSVKAG